ncbi:MAG TPA: hypothetical protein DCO71_01665, partial [Gammaproteobacteria bacterium]|nr:hypothetical protein [Gammaproteobacteria bacterium]
GFEPWEGYPSTVFKTAAFDHSATSPMRRQDTGIQYVFTSNNHKNLMFFKLLFTERMLSFSLN